MNGKSTKEVIIEVREFFTDRKNWGNGVLYSPHKKCLCLLGAIAVQEQLTTVEGLKNAYDSGGCDPGNQSIYDKLEANLVVKELGEYIASLPVYAGRFDPLSKTNAEYVYSFNDGNYIELNISGDEREEMAYENTMTMLDNFIQSRH